MAGISNREIALDTLIEILEHGQFSHIYLKAVLDKYSYLDKIRLILKSFLFFSSISLLIPKSLFPLDKEYTLEYLLPDLLFSESDSLGLSHSVPCLSRFCRF